MTRTAAPKSTFAIVGVELPPQIAISAMGKRNHSFFPPAQDFNLEAGDLS